METQLTWRLAKNLKAGDQLLFNGKFGKIKHVDKSVLGYVCVAYMIDGQYSTSNYSECWKVYIKKPKVKNVWRHTVEQKTHLKIRGNK